MRGKVVSERRRKVSSGITPAYAGKSSELQTRYYGLWDHPRLCGEKITFFLERIKAVGSPPPMRGKDSVVTIFHCSIRITPAYAGKRIPLCCPLSGFWDHPRLCGEKRLVPFALL